MIRIKYLISPTTVLLCILILASCGNAGKDPKEKAAEQNEAKFTRGSSEKDAAFVVDAYSHGLCEIEKANIEKNKASDKSIKSLAEKQAGFYTQTNAMLRDLASLKQISLPSALTAEQVDDINEWSKEKPGYDFDKSYLHKIVKKQEKTVELYEKAAAEATDPDIQKFFQHSLPELREHLQAAMSWKDKYDKR